MLKWVKTGPDERGWQATGANGRRYQIEMRGGFRLLPTVDAISTVVTCETLEAAQADHVIPVRLGGTNNPDNLLTACIPCSQGKAARSLIEPVRMKPVHTNTYAPVVFWRYLTKNEASIPELTDQQIDKLCALASKYGSLWVTCGMCYLKRQFGFSLPVDLAIELVEHKAAHGFITWGLLESLSWQKLEVISAQGWLE